MKKTYERIMAESKIQRRLGISGLDWYDLTEIERIAHVQNFDARLITKDEKTKLYNHYHGIKEVEN